MLVRIPIGIRGDSGGSGVDDVVDHDELELVHPEGVDHVGDDPDGVDEVVELPVVDKALELHGVVIWSGGCRSNSQWLYPLGL